MDLSQSKRIYLAIGLSVVVIALLSHLHRSYVYQNQINDFGFANTIGSLFSVVGFCCVVWGFKAYTRKEKNVQIIVTTLVYSFFWIFLDY